MKRSLHYFLIMLLSFSMTESHAQSAGAAVQQAQGTEDSFVVEHPQMYAVLYQQTAAEYRALCYQAFNMAIFQLDRMLEGYEEARPASVVVDIDETMLDNSPYEARCIVEGMSYPEGWDQWVNEASAHAVPGALEFLQHAKTKGVQVYYVSNRKENFLMATMQNMKQLGFPFAQPDHMLFRRDEVSKKGRRGQVAEKTNIILLIGDNLADFSEVFEGQDVRGRTESVDRFRGQFGSRFIMLPNAIYGDWLNALFSTAPGATGEEKAELMKNALITK